MKGTIKTLLNEFGFILIEGRGDLFFHANDLKGVAFEQLKPGDTVTFEEGQGKKGPCAINVELA